MCSYVQVELAVILPNTRLLRRFGTSNMLCWRVVSLPLGVATPANDATSADAPTDSLHRAQTTSPGRGSPSQYLDGNLSSRMVPSTAGQGRRVQHLLRVSFACPSTTTPPPGTRALGCAAQWTRCSRPLAMFCSISTEVTYTASAMHMQRTCMCWLCISLHD